MANALTVRIPADERSFRLGTQLTIGRAEDNDIRIDSPDVSRHHAVLRVDAGGRAVVMDLGSANGTSVNGIRLAPREARFIGPGDNLLIASLLLAVEAEAVVPAATVIATPAPSQDSPPRSEAVQPVVRPAPWSPSPSPWVARRAAEQPAELPPVLVGPAPRREAMRRTGPRRRSGVAIGFAIVILFWGFVASNAVDTRLLESSYYKGVLVHADAYNRAYKEVAVDPQLSGQTSDLLGGINVLPTGLVGAVQTVIPATALQGLVEAAIDRLIAYLKNNTSFDVGIDVTAIVGGVGLGALGEITGELIGRPTREAATYAAFLADLRATLERIKQEHRLPDIIPTYEVPDDKKAEVTNLIVSAGGLQVKADAGTIAEVRDAVNDSEIEDALKAGMGSLLTAPALGTQQSLIHGEFIQEVHEGGRTHYVLGPPPEVNAQLDDVLSIVHTVSWAAGWGRFACLGLVAALLLSMASLFRANRAAMLRWMGVPLLFAGGVGFVGWMIGREIAKRQILDASLGSNSTLPQSFQQLYRDVLATAATDLTPTIWVPLVAAAVVGAALVVGSRIHNSRFAIHDSGSASR